MEFTIILPEVREVTLKVTAESKEKAIVKVKRMCRLCLDGNVKFTGIKVDETQFAHFNPFDMEVL